MKRVSALRAKGGFMEAFGIGAIVLVMLVALGVTLVNFAAQSRQATEAKSLLTAITSRANLYSEEANRDISAGAEESHELGSKSDGILGIITRITSVADNGDTRDLSITAQFADGRNSLSRVVTVARTSVTHIAGFDENENVIWTDSEEANKFSLWGVAEGSVRALTAEEQAGAHAGTKWSVADKYGAIDSNGSLWMWGSNDAYQMGNGTDVPPAGGIWKNESMRFRAVSTGGGLTLAIDTSGRLFGWGQNSGDNLIYGAAFGSVTTPTQIAPERRFTSVFTNELNAYAIGDDGALYAWGNQTQGRLGGATGATASTPGVVKPGTAFQQFAVGNAVVVAIDATGKLWTWGTGPIGDGTNAVSAAPKQIITGQTFVSVDASTENTFLALDSTGKIWSWGKNTLGQVGNGLSADVLTPFQVPGGPFASVSSIGTSSYALDTSGQLWGWGYNYGMFGTSGGTLKVPTKYLANYRFISFTEGPRNGSLWQTIAIDGDGSLWVLRPSRTPLWPISIPISNLDDMFRMPAPPGLTTLAGETPDSPHVSM